MLELLNHGINGEASEIESDDDEVTNEMEALLYSQVHYSSSLVLNDSQEKDGSEQTSDNENPNKEEQYLEVNVGQSFVLGLSNPEVKENEQENEWDINDADKGIERVSKTQRYYKGSEQLPNISCYNCNEKGHLAKDCMAPKKVPKCYLCGVQGHNKTNCPNDICYNCMEIGHRAKDCTEKKKKSMFHSYCSRCHWKGHVTENCPEIWRQYHVTIKGHTIIKPSSRKHESKQRYCYNCASSSHFGESCRMQRSWRGPVFSQFVVSYDKCKSSKSDEGESKKESNENKKRDEKIEKKEKSSKKDRDESIEKKKKKKEEKKGKEKSDSKSVDLDESVIHLKQNKEQNCATDSKKGSSFINNVKKICLNLKKKTADRKELKDEISSGNKSNDIIEPKKDTQLEKSSKNKKSNKEILKDQSSKKNDKTKSKKDTKKDHQTKDAEINNTDTSKSIVQKKKDKIEEKRSIKRKIETSDEQPIKKRKRKISDNPWVSDSDVIEGVAEQKFSLFNCLGIDQKQDESEEEWVEKDEDEPVKSNIKKKIKNSDKKQKEEKNIDSECCSDELLTNEFQCKSEFLVVDDLECSHSSLDNEVDSKSNRNKNSSREEDICRDYSEGNYSNNNKEPINKVESIDEDSISITQVIDIPDSIKDREIVDLKSPITEIIDDSSDCIVVSSPRKKKLKMDYTSLKNLADILISDEDESFNEHNSSAMSQLLTSPCINISDDDTGDETDIIEETEENKNQKIYHEESSKFKEKTVQERKNDLTRYDPTSINPDSLKIYGLSININHRSPMNNLHHSRSAPDLRNFHSSFPPSPHARNSNRNFQSNDRKNKDHRPWLNKGPNNSFQQNSPGLKRTYSQHTGGNFNKKRKLDKQNNFWPHDQYKNKTKHGFIDRGFRPNGRF